jgi:exosortase
MTEALPNRMTALDQFRREFAICWQKMPGIGWFLLLAAAWTLLFAVLGNATLGYVNTSSLFGWLDWVCSRKNTGDEHIPFMLLVVLGLFWWKRQELTDVPKRMWWPGGFVVLLGMGFHILGFSAFQECRISLVGFFVGLYGLMGVVWGPQFMRASFFPVVVFCFFLPIGGTLADKITFPLRLLATQITAGLSQGIGINVIQQGTTLLDSNGSFTYEVAAACSGIRSLTVTLLISVIYAFLGLSGWSRRIVMIGAAFPLAVAANVMRLLTIIIAAESFGQTAGNEVHESWWMSLIPYVPMVFGIFWLGRWLKGREVTQALAANPDAPRWELSDLKVPLAVGAIGACFFYAVPDFGNWVENHPVTVVGATTLMLSIWIVAPAISKRVQSSVQPVAFAGPRAIVLVILVLECSTAGFLVYRQTSQKLGLPGVKVVAQPVFGVNGEVVGTNRVELPSTVLNFESELVPVQKIVLDWLPKDTTYGQRLYKAPDGFQMQMNAVLMGTDRTSIHKPQYCLEGAGWHIEKSEPSSLKIAAPTSYDLPVMKLTATRDWVDPQTGQKRSIRGLYVYWFVSEDQLSADHDQRMLWAGLDMLRTGVLKRWAYIGCLSACLPGQEDATYARMKDLIAASVPQFHVVGSPARLAQLAGSLNSPNH